MKQVCVLITLVVMLCAMSAEAQSLASSKDKASDTTNQKKSQEKKIEAAPGDIIVYVIEKIIDEENADKDSDKGSVTYVNKARVKVTLPGKNSTLKKIPNVLFDVVDGSAGDRDEEENGVVLLRAADISGYVAESQEFSVFAIMDKYFVKEDVTSVYSSKSVNNVKIVLRRRNVQKKN